MSGGGLLSVLVPVLHGIQLLEVEKLMNKICPYFYFLSYKWIKCIFILLLF